MNKVVLPKSAKPRYEILDGLRGVAAVIVVLFHLLEAYSHGNSADQIINHGYLAVDFFFALSGFVIGYAYDDRWNKMSTWDFFKRRIVRLQPMVIIGTIIGLCFYFFQMSPSFPLIGHVEGWKIFVAFIMGCLMIPCGKSLDIRGWSEMNSFNGPNWSLTWEYLANILYGLFVRRFNKVALTILVLASAFCTFDLCLNLNVFGLIGENRISNMYTVIGGWSLDSEQIYIGLTRLFYPFFCGLLISRIGKFIHTNNGFLWSSLLLTIILSIPCIGEAGNILNGWYNALAIVLIFPVIIMLGAGSTVKGKQSIKICNFLGEISYPIYIVHFPLIYLQMAWIDTNPDAPLYAHIVVAAGVFILSMAMAYASLKLYDIPVRKWLTEKWLKR